MFVSVAMKRERKWVGLMVPHTYTHKHTHTHRADGLGCGQKKELEEKNGEEMERTASNSH